MTVPFTFGNQSNSIPLSELDANFAAVGNASNITYTTPNTTNTRAVNAKLADVVSVKDFGAVGNGVVDDTAAIQAAISYVSSLGGGAIYFPAGIYSGYVLIDSVNNITLYGDGKGASTIYRPLQIADGAAVISIKTTTTTASNITIKDLTIKSSTTTGTYYDAFGIECNRNSGTSPNLAYNISVIDCEVNTIRSAGIALRNVINAKVSGCYVHNTGRDGIQLVAQNGYVANNYIEYTGDDCIAVHGASTAGGAISGYTPSYQVVNNYCGYQSGGRGIASAGGRDTVITGNTLRGYGQFGIFILYDSGYESPVRFVVSGNIILETTNTGTSGAAIGLLGTVNQTTYPTDNFVDYPTRPLIYTAQYPISHIKIVNNYMGISEYQGKTVNGVTYFNPQYGVRFIAPGAYQNVSIDENTFYGLSQSAVQADLTTAAEYAASKVQVRNNDFRACNVGMKFTGGAPTSLTWVDDIFITGNYIDGTNSLGYSTPAGIVANGILKIFITGNSFNALTTSFTNSTSSASSYNNVFQSSPTFGTITHSYSSSTNTWTEA
jgi:hypothetical protein